MTPPNITKLASAFCETEYHGHERELQYPKIHKAMTVAACQTAEYYNHQLKDLVDNVKSERQKGVVG